VLLRFFCRSTGTEIIFCQYSDSYRCNGYDTNVLLHFEIFTAKKTVNRWILGADLSKIRSMFFYMKKVFFKSSKKVRPEFVQHCWSITSVARWSEPCQVLLCIISRRWRVRVPVWTQWWLLAVGCIVDMLQYVCYGVRSRCYVTLCVLDYFLVLYLHACCIIVARWGEHG